MPEPCADGVPWGDVFCLTDPETYRYIFTLYTDAYVQACRVRRGELIEASPENVILPVSALTLEHLRQGVEAWVSAYYPGLAGIPIRLEDPEQVCQMIQASLTEDPE